MIHKRFIRTDEGMVARVTFRLPDAIWADSIYLVGDFNDWNRRSHPLRPDHAGHWMITIDFEAGPAYEFRYLCDGEWMNDDDADAYWNNPHGSHNSVVMTDPAYQRPDE